MKRTNIAPSHVLATALALGVGLLAPNVSACGGFFCSRTAPVFQSAERIIFAQDGNEITQIIEVAYEGPSEKFSWVLPVPGIPEPDVSSKEVFNLLDAATAPRYQLQRDYSCSPIFEDEERLASSPNAGGDADGAPAVTVLDAGSVGPFDYETISVTVDNSDTDPADIAVAWLEENGYDITDETGAVLGPYLANGLNLIAFRLQKGQSTGAIRPIVLQYEASASSIPILPTSVAANDDMPILVWVLGKDRAVPTNYRGLELNELLIDWFNPSASYGAVVTAAANEAGGQGFVTELAEDASQYADVVRPTEDDIARIFENGGDFENQLSFIAGRLGSWDGFTEAASQHIELRDGVTMEEFTTCPDCYFHGENYDIDLLESIGFEDAAAVAGGISEDDPIYNTDLEALEASLRETVIQPLLDAGDLLEKHDTITRLFTTMSADEMTKDPVFEFNADAEDVSNLHTAVQVLDNPKECSGDGLSDPWTITLEDGTKVYGEGDVWPHSLGDTDLSPNARIVQFSTSGAPEVIGDMVDSNMTEHESSSAGDPTNPDPPSGSDTGSGSDSGSGSDTGSGSDDGTGSDSGSGSDSDTGSDSKLGSGTGDPSSSGSDGDSDSDSGASAGGDDGGCAHSPGKSPAPFSWAGLALGAAFLARRRRQA